MMSQATAMPLSVAELFAKIDHLTNEEQWAYVKLVMKTWARNCRWFPDHAKDLARLLGMGVKRWLKIRPRIAPLFDLSDGVWREPDLAESFQRVAQRNQKFRANGLKGGRPKFNKINDIEKPDGFDLVSDGSFPLDGPSSPPDPLNTPYNPPSSQNIITLRARAREIYDPVFQAWWLIWPKERQVDKRDAYAQWKVKVIAAGVSVELVMEQTRRYTASREACFMRHPARWLAKGKWEDEQASNENKPTETRRMSAHDAETAAFERVTRTAPGDWWADSPPAAALLEPAGTHRGNTGGYGGGLG